MKKNIVIDRKKGVVTQIIPVSEHSKKIRESLKELSLVAEAGASSFSSDKQLLSYTILWQNKKYICIQSKYYEPLPMYIAKHGFSLKELCQLAQDLCTALCFLHAHSLLHMDIKADNIFVQEGHYLLGDFDSIVKLKNASASIRLRMPHTTLLHAAPELKEKGIASIQSDIYSLGCTLLELSNKNSDTAPVTIFKEFSNPNADMRPNDLKKYREIFENLKNTLKDDSYQLPQMPPSSYTEQTTDITPVCRKKYRLTFLIGIPLLLACLLAVHTSHHVRKQNTSNNTIENHHVKTQSTSSPSDMDIGKSSPSYTDKQFFAGKSPPRSPVIAGCNALTKINLEDKNLMDISGLQNLNSLKTLYLGNNQIVDLSPLQSLSHLEVLYLNSNLISDLLPLREMRQMEILLLQDNNIQDVRPLSKLYHLQHLDISDNPALSNVSSLTALKSLKFLNLIGTNVSKKEQNLLANALPNCTIIR